VVADYGFDADPLVYIEPDGATFTMADEAIYTGKLGDSWLIPQGFRTDFATIPAFVSWAVAKLGAYTLAAIVHDLLCEGLNKQHHLRRWLDGKVAGIPAAVDRPTANAVDTDAIFYRICRDHGVDLVTANLLWVGVRWGALANPARREGWLSTAPAVLGLSLLYAPVLVPASVLVLAGRGVLRVARLVCRG
jgi:hypothetical protein